MLKNCPICGSYNIGYTANGIICENNNCPGKRIVITTSDNTKEEQYMHDHTKQQLEKFYDKFGDDIYDHYLGEEIDVAEDVKTFLKQALKSQAEMIRAEMDSTIGSLNGLGGCECCISKVNKQKANLDELINSFE